jgi:hypothetical protein
VNNPVIAIYIKYNICTEWFYDGEVDCSTKEDVNNPVIATVFVSGWENNYNDDNTRTTTRHTGWENNYNDDNTRTTTRHTGWENNYNDDDTRTTTRHTC